MKKTHMSIAPNGKAVLQPESQVQEVSTLTQEAAAPGSTEPEPEPQPEQVTAAAIPAATATAPTPAPEPEPLDTRTVEQKIADLQKVIDERQKLISRFNDLSTKHYKFSAALEEITPDACEVIIIVDGRRFTSTDPVAVRRFIHYQVESYATELSQVANSLLI